MKILDCTLRDGGYYTNWDFDKEIARTYFESLNHLPIEYLEIGYRSNPLKGYLGEYFYCPDYVLQHAKEISNKKLVIILNVLSLVPFKLYLLIFSLPEPELYKIILPVDCCPQALY
jgi:4-hydroxy 2-oxovalerate aldolase